MSDGGSVFAGFANNDSSSENGVQEEVRPMGRPRIIRTGQRGRPRILRQQLYTIVEESVPQTVKEAMDSPNWVELRTPWMQKCWL